MTQNKNHDNRIVLSVPDDYKVIKIEGGEIILQKKEQSYPKTYKDCCDVLSISPYYNLRYHTYERCHYNEFATSNELRSLEDKLNTLGKLIICRNAYWKIAGEEMGLGKPWDPMYGYKKQIHCVGYSINKNNICFFRLVFPTEKIRNAFLDNFKDLIEHCKELL